MSRQGSTPVNTSSTNKNLLLNSDMTFAQRGTGPITGAGSAQYSVDRWTGWFPSAGTYTSPQIRQSSLPANFPGDQDISLCHRLVASTSTNGSHVRYQRVESYRLEQMESNVVSFGFLASVNNYQSCQITLIQTPNGRDNWTGQIVQSSPVFNVEDTNGGWQLFKFENVTLTNRDGLECRITFFGEVTPGGGTDTYVTQAMCNEGSFLQPWSLAEETTDKELAACQRFYEKSYRTGIAPGTPSSIGVWGYHSGSLANGGGKPGPTFKVQKRSIFPVMTTYASSGTANAHTRVHDSSGVTTSNTVTGFSVAATDWGVYAHSGQVGARLEGVSYHWTADAEL